MTPLRRVWKSDKRPWLRSKPYSRSRNDPKSSVDDRHSPRPAGGGPFDLDRKTRNHETGRGQLLALVQLLDVAVTDMASGLVAFPDQAGVFGLRVFLGGVDERRVPAPAIDAGQPHAALKQVHCRLIAHAAAGSDVILLPVFGPGASIDHHDLQWRKRVTDALEFVFDILGGRHIAVGQMPEIQLHAWLQAPLQRHFIDRP